ncbi:YlbF family regulator [Desulfovirgula thermocuniculi]|uniref:YlbF family regulator n=1 Tax=Desulfovirgula thermocuniculi TaxID=348842 RepID=UPI0004212213|nr:YlbF family regulator [Desulfovirgula thermocuniculi]
MSVREKAQELGEEIARSRELAAMVSAQQAMLQDTTAREIIEEFNHKQRLFRMLQSQGFNLTASQKAEVESLERRMLDNPLIAEYIRAQQEFEKLLDEVNKIIDRAISSSLACASGCCDSCDECG